MWYPYVLDVDSDDNIYVASYSNALPINLQVFHSNGTWMKDIPLPGSQPQGVKGLAIDRSTGDIYVAYNWLLQVVRISANGTLLNTWTSGAQRFYGIYRYILLIYL